MEVALWLYLAITVIGPCLLLVRQIIFALPQFQALGHVLLRLNPEAYLEPITFVVLWVLTTHEPGPARVASPLLWRLGARWLRILGFSAYVVLEILRATSASPPASDYGLALGLQISAVTCNWASILLLLMLLRQYAITRGETKTANRLKWASLMGVLGLIVVIASYAVMWLRSVAWGSFMVPVMVVIGVVYWGSLMWGIGSAAVCLRRALAPRQRTVGLGVVFGYLLVALIVGKFAGELVGYILRVQAARIPDGEFGRSLLLRSSWMAGSVGLIVGAAVLPSRLELAKRVSARSRRPR